VEKRDGVIGVSAADGSRSCRDSRIVTVRSRGRIAPLSGLSVMALPRHTSNAQFHDVTSLTSLCHTAR
jgi:hypothetical protein